MHRRREFQTARSALAAVPMQATFALPAAVTDNRMPRRSCTKLLMAFATKSKSLVDSRLSSIKLDLYPLAAPQRRPFFMVASPVSTSL